MHKKTHDDIDPITYSAIVTHKYNTRNSLLRLLQGSTDIPERIRTDIHYYCALNNAVINTQARYRNTVRLPNEVKEIIQNLCLNYTYQDQHGLRRKNNAAIGNAIFLQHITLPKNDLHLFLEGQYFYMDTAIQTLDDTLASLHFQALQKMIAEKMNIFQYSPTQNEKNLLGKKFERKSSKQDVAMLFNLYEQTYILHAQHENNRKKSPRKKLFSWRKK